MRRCSRCEHATGFCSTTRQRGQCLTGQDLILQINTNATAKKAERRLKCHWITSPQPKHKLLQIHRPLYHCQYLVLGDSSAPPSLGRDGGEVGGWGMGGGGGAGEATAGCASLGSVRVKTCSVCVIDRPDAQSNLGVQGTKTEHPPPHPTPTVPRLNPVLPRPPPTGRLTRVPAPLNSGTDPESATRAANERRGWSADAGARLIWNDENGMNTRG